jgi:coenzyme PQQ precursor peptide PqqA
MATATALEVSARNQLPSSIQKEATMKWRSPRVDEIAVGLEINSYASAERN